ncbi:hypothetical protein TVAG_099010 [Trichomonas vaginalis G3]|uniref:Uncharacterized protein n=1 Tax=Trichomonas vaginalis (strain ATCC PRA-98 / G3) TaxID=412133 RepID=A2EMF2_TRIV3|nr:protein ubiquitination [Trichomonas vaginalis G3]EAY06190.1 hypothetical protein TVAG_099010 [Trichomonas vaginalis G3]KAI5544350.1 protein ubiquitination [Trichomonas vaginalis G3]|eukprot:XP_001318413.1 hypothetical protein [Trichomonas vaginalis G3]
MLCGIWIFACSELRSIYKYYIDAYVALYQLKTEKEELNTIYKMIKTELLKSMKYLPKNIIRDILDFIPYNNRYTKSYLSPVKCIFDDFHVTDVNNVEDISSFLFYKEYGIKLYKNDNLKEFESVNLDIQTEKAIFGMLCIMTKKNGDKQTALHYAVANSSKEIVELLVSHGANINEKDGNGITPLQYAVGNNHKELVEFLVSHGANINGKHGDGQTALHCSTCYNNHKEVAEFPVLQVAKKNSFGDEIKNNYVLSTDSIRKSNFLR